MDIRSNLSLRKRCLKLGALVFETGNAGKDAKQRARSVIVKAGSAVCVKGAHHSLMYLQQLLTSADCYATVQ